MHNFAGQVCAYTVLDIHSPQKGSQMLVKCEKTRGPLLTPTSLRKGQIAPREGRTYALNH